MLKAVCVIVLVSSLPYLSVSTKRKASDSPTEVILQQSSTSTSVPSDRANLPNVAQDVRTGGGGDQSLYISMKYKQLDEHGMPKPFKLTPDHILERKRNRYQKEKERRKRILSQPDNTAEKQELLAKIANEKAKKKIHNERNYSKLQFAVTTGSASEIEMSRWNKRQRNHAYRGESKENEEEHQKFLQKMKQKYYLKKALNAQKQQQHKDQK